MNTVLLKISAVRKVERAKYSELIRGAARKINYETMLVAESGAILWYLI